MDCLVCENASPRQNRPSLALTEGVDDHTHYSGPPRRWGGPVLSAKAIICRGCENACPRRNQPSFALTEGEDVETHFSGPPTRWGGPEWSAKAMVLADSLLGTAAPVGRAQGLSGYAFRGEKGYGYAPMRCI